MMLGMSASVIWGRVTAGLGPILREARSKPTMLLCAFCVLVCLPLAIILTPDQDLTIAGQRLSVGARDPDFSLSGPAQLVQIGNTDFDIMTMRVYGPLRPKLALGPVQRNDDARAAMDPHGQADVRASAAGLIAGGFVRWYGLATVLLLGLVFAASTGLGSIRMLAGLRRFEQASHQHGIPARLWRHFRGQLIRSAVAAVTVTMLAWAVSGGLAYRGATNGLKDVHSLSDLVGTYHLSPSPIGPTVRGFSGVVIGDSRAARVGGPALAEATPEDIACGRSADSLAVEIGQLTSTRVRNLACSGASISSGLIGQQAQGDQVVPPQIGLLKQMEGIEFVVVMIGPNDLYWADFLRYCYGVDNCEDNLTQGEFAIRLAIFDRDYGYLLQDLNELPGKPQIIVTTSYDVFSPNANCADTQGPNGLTGLSPGNLTLLANMNKQLNDVLVAGAEKYQFATVKPALSTLCEPGHPQLGRDLQGLGEGYPFHPTAIGTVRIAAGVAAAVSQHTERKP
jgi:hypothetical protein